jgi:hypothetical protein
VCPPLPSMIAAGGPRDKSAADAGFATPVCSWFLITTETCAGLSVTGVDPDAELDDAPPPGARFGTGIGCVSW